MIATAMRVVNAIPYVCEAPPGLVTSAELPPTLPRHAFDGGRLMGALDGKVAIVTGTSRGVGVGIAKRLLEAGATVVGCSRRELPALPAAEGIPGAAERSAQWVCDQGDWRQIDAFVARVVERFGRLDILVNNAGGTVPTPARRGRAGARREDPGRAARRGRLRAHRAASTPSRSRTTS